MTTFEKIFGALEEKKEWRQLQARAKALPPEFFSAYKALTKYLFNMGLSDWHIFGDILDLFENAVANERTVVEVLGADIATFADELLLDNKNDWREKHRQKLNAYFANK
ncbi:DUF1048 domain-containing protein [Lactococcus kimchii]|uniref:DUF1048 domain-containing protein n=1 Tax=Lactococcus sp. S-13 TaxID=2507158 RepID=UPI001023323C|nr:DUF1048 domain-containing protein [Lactococcus sp. S-13]RZI49223.1 DUF1048 domain-containing protein [Lactococcus sp. S-13]